MEHVIGAPSTHRLAWKRTTTSNHPPIRRYYMSRNLVILVRTYFRKEPTWALATIFFWFQSTLLMLFFKT